MSLTETQTGEGPEGNSSGPKPHDPLYRCEHCGWLVTTKHIRAGGCSMCGGRRLKYAVMVKDEEVEWLRGEGYELTQEQWSERPANVR